MTATHPAARRYLKELDRALVDLPRSRRREIVSEISGHIDEAAPDSNEAQVRNVLDELGEPETIAADARDRFGVTRSRGGLLEGLAIVGLLIGGVLLPAVGWLIGLVLLWVSSTWTLKDKMIGTLVLPGGLAFPMALFLFAPLAAAQECAEPVRRSGEAGVEICSSAPVTSQPLLFLVMIVVTLLPIATAIYLGRRAFRQS